MIIKIFILGMILAGFSNLFWGIFVYLKNRRGLQNKIFLFVGISFGIWTFSYANWLSQNNYQDALFWSRMLNLGATLIPIFFLHWIITFLQLKKKPLLIFGYLLTAIFAFFSFSSLYIKDVKPVSISQYWPQAGWLYTIFLIFCFIGFFGYAFILLIKSRNLITERERKIQWNYIFWGSLISCIGGSFNFPLMYGIKLFPILTLVTIFHPFLWAHGILKHQLFNVKVIATEFFLGLLIIILFINIFFYASILELSFKILIFITTAFIAILLMRSILQEVRTREEMEKLAGDLEIANERLKELDKAKSDFVSIASHQLRTPVTAIKGYSSMLLEGSFGEIPEKAKSATEKIFESSNRLVHLITDFLTLSRIERGKIEYDFQKTDLKAIVVSVMDEFKAANIKDKKNLDLSLDIDEKEDYTLTIDQEKIRQVIYNIIENAMKYTPKGFIKVSLYKTPDKSKVVLSVQDSGIGMNKESLGKIFRKFGQAGENGKIETTSGVGLGLYVAKEIMKAHNGDILAESKGEGTGSTFYIELPVNFVPTKV